MAGGALQAQVLAFQREGQHLMVEVDPVAIDPVVALHTSRAEVAQVLHGVGWIQLVVAAFARIG
jgi:hypothetical protein